jgi:alpha-glucosidase
MPMPPMWALGFHQSRYSYYPESRVRFIASNFRERRIPADAIWLDIHYLEGYNPFTWDHDRFPDPARMIADLKSQGFRLVTILDPHPKKQPGWDVYDSGLAGDHFVKDAGGKVLEAPVWPSNAEKDPGPSVFPDFSKPAARQWWGSLYKRLTDIGVAGIWNDMNEPALFVYPPGTMPLDARHDGEGQPTDHREIHNVYGQLMTRSTFEGLLRLRPDERPFVLTRATFAGGQRYAALWPGDNVSTWTALLGSIATLESLGISGMPFVGTDIGGFAEVPTADLFTRWLQMGVFHPFMRAHTTFGTDDQEPWSYGVTHEIANRKAIELRYQLLPEIYNVMHEASETGIPAIRPAFLEFPADNNTWDQDDQFMFGGDLLVAPVVRAVERVRGVYLPKGTDWFDFWTGQRYEGGQGISVPVTLESIPVFARAGAFVFQQPVVQSTDEMRGLPLLVTVFPAAKSEATLYEDDGHSLEYQKGNFSRRRFTQARNAATDGREQVILQVAAPEGPYRPAARSIIFSVNGVRQPSAVSASGSTSPRALPRLAAAEFDQRTEGWSVQDNVVRVKFRDDFAATTITIEP